MKKALLLTLALMLSATMAFAQAGSVGVFADVAGTDCNLLDVVPGLCTYHFVHVLHGGATACQFAAPLPSCFAGTYLSDGQKFPVTIGNSQTGVSIGYGGCVGAPTNVLDISLFCQGLTGPCCYYTVVPDPNAPSGEIEVVDCSNALLYATGGTGIINSNANCDCNVPAEDSTWGKVKSLYTD